jgi:NitT/TauT family transport system permease protein
MRAYKAKNPTRAGIELPDLIALMLILSLFTGMLVIASHWFDPIQMNQREFDLSLLTLPRATFLSISRIVIAYLISLMIAITVGYIAAHSRAAERFIIPIVDILQSVPTFGFLPGTVLLFIALFPSTNIGLEISAIIMIVISMVWNMLLSFYASIKSIPQEYAEIIRACRYSRIGVLLRLEIPFAINGLVWNSMLSVAAGWFFLTICESFTLGEYSFKLVGLGSYMAYAAERGDTTAILAGCAIMILTLFLADTFIWRPLLRWAERFQGVNAGTNDEEEEEESGLIDFFSSSKRITRFVRRLRRYYSRLFFAEQKNKRNRRWTKKFSSWILKFATIFLGVAIVSGVAMAVRLVSQMESSQWIILFRDASYTCMRVFAVLLFSSLIMIPFGLWLGSQPKLTRRFRTLIQVIAAFPAPMIFPVITTALLALEIPISIVSVALMMFGAQWYLLFNVIAGASTVPREFVEVAETTGMSKTEILKRVFLPAAMPSIATGWLTAAGGAWNASIVAEIVTFRGRELVAPGLGSYIALAAGSQRYGELVAAVVVMVILIVAINRFLWARLYNFVESRFRL